MQLLIGNDQTITVSGLKDQVSGDFINDATVTVTVKTRDGANVAGETWPLALQYVTGSDGDYRGTLEDGLELTPGIYVVEARAVATDDLVAFWREEVSATYRRF